MSAKLLCFSRILFLLRLDYEANENHHWACFQVLPSKNEWYSLACSMTPMSCLEDVTMIAILAIISMMGFQASQAYLTLRSHG